MLDRTWDVIIVGAGPEPVRALEARHLPRERARVVRAGAARVAPLFVADKRVDGREVRGGQRVVVALRGRRRRVAVAGRRHVSASARLSRLLTTCPQVGEHCSRSGGVRTVSLSGLTRAGELAPSLQLS